MQFTASTTAETACLFTFGVDDSTGTIFPVGSASTGSTLATCSHPLSGTAVNFNKEP